MTLVELLVVVAILGVLAVTVLPTLSSTAELRRGKEAARILTSFVSKAQSRAIGRRDWSGFMIIATSTATLSFAASDLVFADVPPVYRGDTIPALLTISATNTAPGVRTASGTIGQLTMSGSIGVKKSDLIRFDGRDYWYELASPATTGTSLEFRMRGLFTGTINQIQKSEGAGQDQHNTPWPPSNVDLGFEIQRQPVRAGSPISLPDGRVIDLYWSGYGPPILPIVVGGTTTYRRFETVASGTLTLNASGGASTAILFDGTGRVRQLIVSNGVSTDRLTVTGPIFLLLGRADRVGQPYDDAAGANNDSLGANWQYADSRWIAIDPLSGAAMSAECANASEDTNASGTLDSGEDYNGNGILDLRAVDPISSQRWIREMLLKGGQS